MGVDIETYRGRIGTFKFATGNDVSTLQCFVNFSGGLKAVFIVTCIGLLLLLTTTEPFGIQNGHAEGLLVSGSQSSGSVWFINMLLLIAGVESNPGPKQFDSQNADNSGILSAPIDVAPVSPQTTSIDVQSLGSLADQSRGSTCEEYEGARAHLNVAQGVSHSTTVVCDSPIDSQEQSRGSQNKDNEGALLDVAPVVSQSTTAVYDSPRGSQNKENEGARLDVAPVVSQFTKVACDSLTGDETEGKMFENILQKLDLSKFYPGKISKRDVIAIDPKESIEHEKTITSLRDLPWMVLKRLICAHSESRDITVSEENSIEDILDLDNVISCISETSAESTDISPLDVFTVVFQCCDPLLKLVLFQKLYLCKLAVPFLYKQWGTNEFYESVLYVWPLRSLAIDNKASKSKDEIRFIEVNIFELPTNVLAFTRFGRPHYSKSKLINSLLKNQECKTFFNFDCPSGKSQRYLSNGQIEMFWLPTIGNKKDSFQEAITFLNMRGDINRHFERNVISFIASFIDVIIIVIDIDSIIKQFDSVKNILVKFSFVILIIANPLRPNEVTGIKRLQNEVTASNSGIHLLILSTHKGDKELNTGDMVSRMHTLIQKQLFTNKTKSYQQRLSSAKLCNVVTDEDDKNCQKGKFEAELLVQKMREDGSPKSWKQNLTPVQTISQQLGKLMKNREREKDFTEGERIDLTIKAIRKKQTQLTTKTVKKFIDILISNANTPLALNYFLCWLQFHIESEKRHILSQLMHENRCAWEKLKMLKSKDTQVESDISNQETVITDLERKIDDASFTVEHFFREIGHIYEAILQLHLCSTTLGLPKLKDISNLIGRLVADGHKIELIHGESFYMPYLWTQTVFKEVDRCIGSSKIMSLSVLGLQSSGKSTLLNTMFGSQFPTRTGRCTRGIHVQLVPVKIARLEDESSPFNYVLVVDTEGLRSPDLRHVHHEHDNELATIITGIGDIAMLNVMGENTSEIKDILQVIVHAFLRLKMTNPKLDIRKSCAFIHQNVADTSASQNMISGLGKLMQTLDEMTKESAKSEGISNITSFNQVIEFDINSQIWYLKNLWQGNPPMAWVNNEYSEGVVDMKCSILKKALTMKDKSYKSLSDIGEQTHNLWKGVLNEDFVFSFRNSLEIKAYMEMERVVNDKLWLLESFICDELIRISQNCFANCNQKENIRSVADRLTNELTDVLADEKIKTEEDIKTYFEKHQYKDIIIQWKNGQQCRIDDLCLSLKHIIRLQIEKSQEKRSVEILTVSSHERHEEELRIKSMEVANEFKGKPISKERKDELFNDIWQSFMTKVVSTTATEAVRTPTKNIFTICLQNILEIHYPKLKYALVQSEYLKPIPNLTKLKGSFSHTGIDDMDISLDLSRLQNKSGFMGETDYKQILLVQISKRVNEIFEKVDDKILQLCQVNDEITEMPINELMRELHSNIEDISKGDTSYSFNSLFYAKIHVHVSRYAHPVFDKHNDNYFRNQGTVARLEQYKQQQKISFEAHLSSRLSEDIVAKLFSHVIESFAKQCTLERLPNKITDELHSRLPSVKNRVIVEICSDLLEKNDFKNFFTYIHAPKQYASLWVTERANLYLFAEEYRVYSTTANSILNMIFEVVENSLKVLMQRCCEEPTMEMWIDNFHSLIQKEKLSIPLENFRNLKMEMKHIHNVEYLTKKTLENLTVSLQEMKNEFSRHGRDSVKWENSNPIDRLMQTIWGCPEQCPFCGEPCAKNENHEGSNHYSIQHRPSCCIGNYQDISGVACLQSCQFAMKLGIGCNRICNERNRKRYQNCLEVFECYLNWDIPTTWNMHCTSKFWMWFVATYTQELHKEYDYKFENIPTSWYEISKQQAKESLLKIYTA